MPKIHLSKADVSELEEQYVLDAIRSGWVAPLGPHVDAFEAEIAERCGVAGAVALSSGTAALHLALSGVGAKPGTAVVLPTMTFAASANAVAYTGAEPVFVDAQLSDGNVDPELMLEAVDTLRREGATVAAAMTVDLFGRCVDYDRLLDELAAREIPVIEDAAEALGATYQGRPAGSFGKAAALSFNGNKIMTTSGGGMLLSDDPELIDRARYLSTQARQPVPWYEHADIGYNYRMSNLLAAFGRAQLQRLDDMMKRRRAIRETYVEALQDVPGVRFLGRDGARGDAEDNCWLTSIVTDASLGLCTPGSLIGNLEAHAIEARHLWKPMHRQPVFRNSRCFDNGSAIQLFERGMALPSGSSLEDIEVTAVAKTLTSLFARSSTPPQHNSSDSVWRRGND